MNEFETLLKLLAGQLGENPNLRHALTESMLVVVEESTEPQPTSYLDLLEHIQYVRQEAEKKGKSRMVVAFKGLEAQLRHELQQAALALHNALRSKTRPDQQTLRRVGLDIQNLPVGFPPAINLVELSEQYLQAERDLFFLQTHFPLPDITQKLTAEQEQTARQVQDAALEAFVTGSFRQAELTKFRKTFFNAVQHHKAEAERTLGEIVIQAEGASSPALIHQVEEWLQQFGSPYWSLLRELSPQYQTVIQELLLRTGNYLGLEALLALAGDKNQVFAKNLVFETLMTMRFGEEFLRGKTTWQTWLTQNINIATYKQKAVEFWAQHSEQIPIVISASLPKLEIPDSLHTLALQKLVEPTTAEFLEARRDMLTAAEIAVLEQTLLPAEEPVIPQEPVFDIEEVQAVEPTEKPLPEVPQEKPLTPEPIFETIAKTAIQVAMGEGVGEAAIESAIEGAKGYEKQLAVTIEEEAEHPPTPLQRGSKVSFAPKKKKPPVKAEPEESVWRDHIFPFVTRNLVFVLAPSFIFIGLLLLVFTLWDKAAWIRYGLTPFMIVGISYALARIGIWLKGEDLKSETPILILQSVATLLAPLSLLFVALLVSDRALALKIRIIWGLCLSAALLVAWSYIFALAITSVYRAMTGIHTYTLLLLNALLLLVPVAQLTMVSGENQLDAGARGILVIGFYAGFLVLFWSMRRVLGKMMETAATTINPTVFYSLTCLGTYLVVWGLTHARLFVLPQPYTYGPLLLLLSFLIVMVEFKLLAIRQQTDRITSLSYAAYFFILLGTLLCLGHDYVRVVALLLAGVVWFYQAVKLADTRHFKISLMLLTVAFSSIALIKGFPASLFPYLALLVAAGLYLFALKFPVTEVADFARSLGPMYLSLIFIVAVLWQWHQNVPPLHYGIAFLLFGLFALYLGATTSGLIHVHAGAGYLVAALPYLGFVNMTLHTFEGNTLVFGLAVIGMLWTTFSTMSGNPAMKDSRSTVLWNIGILAFCLLCLRLVFKDTLDMSASPFLQFQILSGPLIIGGLMLLAGYFTRSYIPVYLGLIVLVIIFPEIKDRFDIPMYSGLGSTFSGLTFLGIVLGLGLWQHLRKEQTYDLIWRKKTFPLQAKDSYLLFANPLVVAAFFLFTRTIFLTYPENVFRPLMPFGIKTCIAVLLSGTAYFFISVWLHKKWLSYFLAYIGFIAIGFGIVHGGYVLTTDEEVFFQLLPLLFVFTFGYGESLCWFATKVLPEEKAGLVGNPFNHLKYVVIWGVALWLSLLPVILYIVDLGRLFSPADLKILLFWPIFPLYLCLNAIRIAWRKNSRWFVIPGYLLGWQFTTLLAMHVRDLRPQTTLYLSTAILVLAVSAVFFVFEQVLGEKKYRIFSPLLWMSLGFLFLFSIRLVIAFYDRPAEFSYLLPQLILWALVSFALGRFLNLGPLWLWSVFLLHLLFLPSGQGYTNFYLSFHPFTLACLAIALAAFSLVTTKVKSLYEHRYAYPWAKNKWLTPSFLFAAVAHIIVIAVFVQSVNSDYRHAWLTVIGLFLAALPALFAAHQIGLSRHFLFGIPYTLACIALMFAIQKYFPELNWLADVEFLHLIALGLSAALLTAVISDVVLPGKDKPYRALKFVVAAGILLLLIGFYLIDRDLARLDLQRLVFSGILALGVGWYFRYLAEPPTNA